MYAELSAALKIVENFLFFIVQQVGSDGGYIYLSLVLSTLRVLVRTE